MLGLLLVKVELDTKVVKGALGEGGAKQQRGIVDVAKEHQRVRVGGRLVEDGARLQDDLVGAKVVALEKDHLVLVRQVERAGRVLHDAKVQRLDALGRRIRATVTGGQQLGAAEPKLDIVGARGKDGLVAGRWRWRRSVQRPRWAVISWETEGGLT